MGTDPQEAGHAVAQGHCAAHVESWNTVARVTQFDDIDFTRVGELRKKFAADYEKPRASSSRSRRSF
jgi:pyruvate/2-oxoglutarate dehydrogenase complex dihydrolipoamide acyltransferase (E2) component